MGFTMKPSVRIVIPGCPPSANKLLRMHYRDRDREKAHWRQMIWYTVAAKDRGWLEAMCAAKKRMKVTIIVRSAKLDDPDNLPARGKLILDTLKPTKMRNGKPVTGLGFIFDDSSEYLQPEVLQEKCFGMKETVLSITEACEEAA